MAFREFAKASLTVVSCSVLRSVPVVVASHAAYGPPSFVFRTFVDFYCMGPGSFLGDQLFLLDFVVCLVFGLQAALEGAESADCETGLGAGSCFVTVLACEAVDRVHVPELEATVTLGAFECPLF